MKKVTIRKRTSQYDRKTIADPLTDIRHTRHIRAVIWGGRLLDRPTLDRLLVLAEQGAKEG